MEEKPVDQTADGKQPGAALAHVHFDTSAAAAGATAASISTDATSTTNGAAPDMPLVVPDENANGAAPNMPLPDDDEEILPIGNVYSPTRVHKLPISHRPTAPVLSNRQAVFQPTASVQALMIKSDNSPITKTFLFVVCSSSRRQQQQHK